jgi:hypothetical protein
MAVIASGWFNGSGGPMRMHNASGVVMSEIKAAKCTSSGYRNFQLATDPNAGFPVGYLHPASWSMPIKPGRISSRNEANIIFTGEDSLAAQGINISSSGTAITFATSGTAAAVAAAVGSATITFTTAGTAAAPLNAIGTATITFTAAASAGAEAAVSGTTTIEFDTVATLTAIGHMVAVPIDTSLTPDSIASAVWAAIAASNNTTGTMGEKLNDAGSASNPWTEIIESGLSAAEILRIVAAALAGTVDGAGTGQEKFIGLDGSTTRIDSTVDVDGNRTVVVVDGS